MENYIGKTIKRMEFSQDEEALKIYFTDGTGIYITDVARSCCEERFMVIEDSLDMLNGEVLKKISIRDSFYLEDTEDEVHEISFLHIETDRDSITISNHNKHNGYYEGFDIIIKEIKND